MKRYYLYLLFICNTIFAQGKLSVDEAIRIGLENNFDIRIARNDLEIVENNRRQGYSGFMPTLDITGNAGSTDSKTESNSPYSFGDAVATNWNGRISLNWTLFDGMAMFVNNNRYLQLEKLGRAQSRFIIENNVVAIMRAYFNLVLQEQLLDISQNSVEISKERYGKMKVRNELGAVSSTDLLNAQVAFNNDKANYLTQNLKHKIAIKELNLQLGLPPDSLLSVEGVIKINKNTYDQSDLFERAELYNSTLLLAKQNVELAATSLNLNKSAFLPRVMLTSGIGYNDVANSYDTRDDITSQTTDASIGLTFSFNLFNGFRDQIKYQNSVIEHKNSLLNYEKESEKLMGLIDERYKAYNNSLSIVDLEKMNVDAAEQNLRLWQEKLETGTVNSLEFRDAQLNYIRARTDFITALYSARIAQLEIEQLTGSIKIE